MSGSFGTNLAQFLDLSGTAQKSSQLSEGKLVSLTVDSSSADRSQSTVTLTTPSSSKSFTVSQALPSKSVLLGRLESNTDGMRVRLLRAQQELESIKTEELMKLLKNTNLDLTGRDPVSLKRELVNSGLISTGPDTSTPGQPQSQSLAGTRLPVQSAPEDLQFPSGSNQAFTVTVVNSGEDTVTLDYQGRTFTVKSEQSLPKGTRLKVTAQYTEGGRTLTVESTSTGTFDRQSLNTLLGKLNLRENSSNRSRLSQVIMKNTTRSPDEILKSVKSEFQVKSVSDRSSALESIKNLIQEARGDRSRRASSSLSDLSRSELNKLLKEFGFEPNQSARDTLRTILETDPQPSKKLAKLAMENVDIARNQGGDINQQRLKSLLFLAKNDLPVKTELVDLLQYAAPDSKADLGQDINNLRRVLQGLGGSSGADASKSGLEKALSGLEIPELDPSGSSGGSDDLTRVLQQLGFDLERQVVKQPDRAGESLRSQLMNLQKSLSQVATEKIQQFTESGNPDLKQESRRVLSQLFKFSMGSVAEDDSVFLFVPFPDGDRTELMKIRFQDDSEGEQLEDEQWSVTINLRLSRLGSIRVEAQRYKEKLNLDFKAEEKPALSLIRDRSEELTEALSERGFDVTFHTGILRVDEESMIDWNLYFDTDQYTGTLDVTI